MNIENVDFLVFDLETQREIAEVGGWKNIPELRMSVGVVWDNLAQKNLVFYQEQVEELIALLSSGRPVIGFNHVKFDYLVLTGYRNFGEERVDLNRSLCHPNNLDMLLDVTEILGHRLKLDSIAKATLAEGKSADGLQALKWWKNYLATDDRSFLDKIVEYCTKDVEVTKKVFLYGVENGKIYYESRAQDVLSTEVNWKDFLEGKPVRKVKKEIPGGEQMTLF